MSKPEVATDGETKTFWDDMRQMSDVLMVPECNAAGVYDTVTVQFPHSYREYLAICVTVLKEVLAWKMAFLEADLFVQSVQMWGVRQLDRLKD